MENIRVPAARKSEAVKALEKINRRAKKNNLPSISYSVSDRIWVEEPRFDLHSIWYNPNDKVKRAYVDIEFEAATVVVEGYEPIATLDYAHERPTVFEWPGQTIPAHMRDVHGECGHCGKSRRRNKVFILRNTETDEYTNVGSTCVKDFLGHNPAVILSTYTNLRKAEDIADEEDEGSSYYAGPRPHQDLNELLIFTVAVVETYGWTSKSRAMNSEVPSTAGLVCDWMWSRYHKEVPKGVDTSEEAFKRYTAKAKEIRELVRNIDPKNTYEDNLQVIAEDGYCTLKEIGLAVSMVNYAQREEDKAKVQEERRRMKAGEIAEAGGHIGEIKQRLDLTVTIKTIRPMDSAWGTTYLMKMVTDDNEMITWFASKCPRYEDSEGWWVQAEEGDRIQIRGTVKKHGEYDGRPETHMTRCKISGVSA